MPNFEFQITDSGGDVVRIEVETITSRAQALKKAAAWVRRAGGECHVGAADSDAPWGDRYFATVELCDVRKQGFRTVNLSRDVPLESVA